MSDSIFDANLDLLGTGVMPGVNEDHVPLWIDVKDVLFDGSSLRPAPGHTAISIASGMFDEHGGLFDSASGLFDASVNIFTLSPPLTSPVKGIHTQRMRSGNPQIFWGTDTKLYRATQLAYSDVTHLSGDYVGVNTANEAVRTTMWSFTTWGDWTFAANGVDTLQVVKGEGAAVATDVVNFPVDSAEIVRTLGPHILCFNCTGNYAPTGLPADQNQFIFCAEDDTEVWDPASNATAGEQVIRELSGPIIAVERIGEALLVYGEQNACVVRYGGDFLFSAKPAVEGLKAVSKNSIAVVGPTHFSLSQDGITQTDGMSLQAKAFPKLGDWLERNVDWTQKSRICNMVDFRHKTIKWTLPLVGGTTTVLVYSITSDSVWWENRPFTAATGPSVFQVPLAGFVNGDVTQLADTPYGRQPVLVTKPIAVGSRTLNAFVDALLVRWSGATAQVSYRFAERQGDLATQAWISLGSITAVEQLLYICQEGCFFQFKIESPESTDRWYLSGLNLLGKGTGRRL